MKSYHLTAVGEGPQCVTTTDTRFTINADLPLLQGGKNTAPQPVELLLASLVSCKQATAQVRAYVSVRVSVLYLCVSAYIC